MTGVDEMKCPECKGHGADPMSDNLNCLPCRTCGGSGSVKANSAPDANDGDVSFREYYERVRYKSTGTLRESK